MHVTACYVQAVQSRSFKYALTAKYKNALSKMIPVLAFESDSNKSEQVIFRLIFILDPLI